MTVPLLPLSFRISGRRVMVAGGGSVAARKVATLLRYGAVVRVVAPEVSVELQRIAAPALTIELRRYAPHDCDDAELIVAATDDAAVNRAIALDARARGRLVNVSDDLEACDFTLPALVERGDVRIGIATSGQSPALAALVRRLVEGALPAELELLAEWLGVIRTAAREQLATDAARTALYREIASIEIVEELKVDRAAARAHVEAICRRHGVRFEEICAANDDSSG